MRFPHHKNGFTLVEALVAATIIVVLVTSLVSVSNFYLGASFSSLNKVKAIFLAEEGIEAVKLLRDQSWTKNISAIPVNTNYFLVYDSEKSFWATTTLNIYTDSIFERKFVLADVYRDSNNDIAPSGTLDPNTRMVTITVSWWDKKATSTKSISTYITNLIGN